MFRERAKIRSLRTYLLTTPHDEVSVQTSLVAGGWHDNEFDANRAGFTIYRYIDKQLEAQHLFPECYKLVHKGTEKC